VQISPLARWLARWFIPFLLADCFLACLLAQVSASLSEAQRILEAARAQVSPPKLTRHSSDSRDTLFQSRPTVSGSALPFSVIARGDTLEIALESYRSELSTIMMAAKSAICCRCVCVTVRASE
jgi:hypothetical protein